MAGSRCLKALFSWILKTPKHRKKSSSPMEIFIQCLPVLVKKNVIKSEPLLFQFMYNVSFLPTTSCCLSSHDYPTSTGGLLFSPPRAIAFCLDEPLFTSAPASSPCDSLVLNLLLSTDACLVLSNRI